MPRQAVPLACAGCAALLEDDAASCERCGQPRPVIVRAWPTATAYVAEVEAAAGRMVVKRSRVPDDPAQVALRRREAAVLSGLAGALPVASVPSLHAASDGAVVMAALAGVPVQDLLGRDGIEVERAIEQVGALVAALAHVPVDRLPLPEPPPLEVEEALELTEELVPAWVAEAARDAARDEIGAVGNWVLVHGDCVPSNWLWDGTTVRLVDFGSARLGSPEADSAAAWARLRLLGAGTRPRLGARLASVVRQPHWPAASRQWRARALVTVVATERRRFRRLVPPVKAARQALLRRALREAVDNIAVARVEPAAGG